MGRLAALRSALVLIRLVYLFMVRVLGWLALLVMADAAAVTTHPFWKIKNVRQNGCVVPRYVKRVLTWGRRRSGCCGRSCE
jgi:hypothetical protein